MVAPLTSKAVSGKKVTVDVVSDILCPWCWVGKRNLEEALRQLPQGLRSTVEVRWHPYQLRPAMSREGALKPPSTPENPRVPPRLKDAGQAVGIDFTGKTDRTPNSLSAHTLLDYAATTSGYDAQNALQEVLFRLYFTDGVFPEGEALQAAAEKVGLDSEEAMAYVEDAANRSRMAKEAHCYSSSRVINGVPSFFFNGNYAFSGAQPPKLFLEALTDALASQEE